eukprot:1183305-Prorocentrum_minimum.AAC.5
MQIHDGRSLTTVLVRQMTRNGKRNLCPAFSGQTHAKALRSNALEGAVKVDLPSAPRNAVCGQTPVALPKH